MNQGSLDDAGIENTDTERTAINNENYYYLKNKDKITEAQKGHVGNTS